MQLTSLRLPSNNITSRQFEILVLMAEGRSNKDIALILWISRQTVRNHQHRMYKVLNVHSGQEALAVAKEAGWITN